MLSSLPSGWFSGDAAALVRQGLAYQQQLVGRPRPILLLERQPEAWLAGFLAAVQAGWPLFLGNPAWGAREGRQAIALSQPALIWGELPAAWGRITTPEPGPPPPADPIIAIPTGGSSGQVRFATHTWATLTAAAQGFQARFSPEPIAVLNVLPLYHVSGLMPVVRSLISGGCYESFPYAELKAGRRPRLDPARSVLSLVPTQLQDLLALDPQGLASWRRLLVGGGPIWPTLLAAARRADLSLVLSYGMTETAALVAALEPAEFRQGRADCGRALPHVELQILDAAGQPLPAGAVGAIALRSPALFQGYYPELRPSGPWWPTADAGYLDADGHLTVLGRQQEVIITGGEKVFPGEVEAAIRGTGMVADVGVIGWPDERWGQRVVALYVPAGLQATPAALTAALRSQLAPYKQPKHWCAVPALPRNAQGKLNRSHVTTMVQQALG